MIQNNQGGWCHTQLVDNILENCLFGLMKNVEWITQNPTIRIQFQAIWNTNIIFPKITLTLWTKKSSHTWFWFLGCKIKLLSNAEVLFFHLPFRQDSSKCCRQSTPWNTTAWKLDMPESPEKYIFFPKEELNYKGKPCGEKIRNGDINHNTFHENCLQNLDK